MDISRNNDNFYYFHSCLELSRQIQRDLMRIVENNMNSVTVIDSCTETMENINNTISSICIEHINSGNTGNASLRQNNVRQNNVRQNMNRQNNVRQTMNRQTMNRQNMNRQNMNRQNMNRQNMNRRNTNQRIRYLMNNDTITNTSRSFNDYFQNTTRPTTTRRTTFDSSFSEVPMTITYTEYPRSTVRRYSNVRRSTRQLSRQLTRGLTIPQIVENTTIINVNDISNNTQGNCPIAMKPLTSLTSVTKINNCGHMFSTVDLYTWLSENNDCPICRCKVMQDTRRTQINTQQNSIIDISNIPIIDISNTPVMDISNTPVIDISNNIVESETESDSDSESDEGVIREEIQTAINNITQTLIDNLSSDMTDISNNEFIIDASIYMR